MTSSVLQFLRELHFIEAPGRSPRSPTAPALQFLWELHFIEASRPPGPLGCARVAVPLGTALH